MTSIVTVENLTEALMNVYRISRKEAFEIAFSVLSIFGFEDRIIDNILDSDRRKLFYMLFDKNIVYPDREKVTLPTERRDWRINYWLLNKEAIMSYQVVEVTEEEQITDTYSTIPDEVWENI